MEPAKPSTKRDNPGKRDDKEMKGKDEAMGTALRSVYQHAVSEAVPDEMLDLLRKLG